MQGLGFGVTGRSLDIHDLGQAPMVASAIHGGLHHYPTQPLPRLVCVTENLREGEARMNIAIEVKMKVGRCSW